MDLFSLFKKEKQLKCDWCKKEMEAPSYFKLVGGTKYNFCSKTCKKNFRKYSDKNKARSCPSCALGR